MSYTSNSTNSIPSLEDNDALLTYRVGPVFCCGPTLPIMTITPPPELTHPPGSSIAEPGIFKHGKYIVSATDLRYRFGVKQENWRQPGQIIIAQHDDQTRGYFVDEILDVIRFPESGWGNVPALLPRGIFSRTLLINKKIFLYADFSKLSTLQGSGYLAEYIEHLEKIESEEKAQQHNRRLIKNTVTSITPDNRSSNLKSETTTKQSSSVIPTVSAIKTPSTNSISENQAAHEHQVLSSDKKPTTNDNHQEKQNANKVKDYPNQQEIKPTNIKNELTPSKTKTQNKINTQDKTKTQSKINTQDKTKIQTKNKEEISSNKPISKQPNSAMTLATNKHNADTFKKSKPIPSTKDSDLEKNKKRNELETHPNHQPIREKKSDANPSSSFTKPKAGYKTNTAKSNHKIISPNPTSTIKAQLDETEKPSRIGLLLILMFLLLILPGSYYFYKNYLNKKNHVAKTNFSNNPTPISEEYLSDNNQIQDLKMSSSSEIITEPKREIEVENTPPTDSINQSDTAIEKTQSGYRAKINEQDKTITIELQGPLPPKINTTTKTAEITTEHTSIPNNKAETALDENNNITAISSRSIDQSATAIISTSPENTIAKNTKAIATTEDVTNELAESASKSSVNVEIDARSIGNSNVKSIEIIHIIVKGDTLWAIAKHYLQNPFLYPELAKLSKIKNPDLIYPGNRVKIIYRD